jgi:RNA polymerase sigma factor (sigma-70 family)
MRHDGVIERGRPLVGERDTGFEGFYRSHTQRAGALAHLITGSRSLGEEIAQEALLAVHDSWDRTTFPAAYLRSTVVNMSRSAQCRLIRERLHLTQLSRVERVTSIPEIDETWTLIKRLPADQRMILVLRFYEDLAIDQIAELLDKPVRTVKSTLHRTLARLKETVDV